MDGQREQKRHLIRRVMAHWGTRFLTLLVSAIALCFAVYAIEGEVDDNTYALQVTTGAVSAGGNLAEEIQYFKIIYEDVDGHTRSHRIFPGEGALRETMEWAVQAGAAQASAAQAGAAQAGAAQAGAAQAGAAQASAAQEQTAEEVLSEADQKALAYLSDLWNKEAVETGLSAQELNNARVALIGLYNANSEIGRKLNEIANEQAGYLLAQSITDREYYQKTATYQALREVWDMLQAKQNAAKNRTQQQQRQTLGKTLGYSVTRNDTPFQQYATDTYLFQPLKKVKAIQKVEILTRDEGTWNCQALRVYRVSAVNGIGMYGYLSDQQYVDFKGTLIAEMERSTSFSWKVDRVFRIVSDGNGSAVLTTTDTPYQTQSTERVFRLDIADQYSAGISALNNRTGAGMLEAKFGEAAALGLRYQDIYGATREVYVPLVLGVQAFALEQGVSNTEKLTGLAQQGDTLALSAGFPDFASLISVELRYGTQAAVSASGITVAVPASRTVLAAEQAGTNADTLSLVGMSVYDPNNTTISVKIEDTVLRPSFSGTPISYYRAPTVQGIQISPIAAGKWGTELPLTPYETGARLLPVSDEERYLVVLKTDDINLASSTGDLDLVLDYHDIEGKAHNSAAINVSNAVDLFYGEYPGMTKGFMYRAGILQGGTLSFIVSLNGVDVFTGAKFTLRQTTDDWQMKGMEIYQLEDLGPRGATWETVTDGNSVSDRRYFRTWNGRQLLNLTQKMLISTGDTQQVNFNSDSTVEIKDTGDWSEYRYSMDYETTQSIGRFAKSRHSYIVAVKVADDIVTNGNYGDSGSKNQFYFQLIFENGKSGYVLANQQLSADGFRTGYEETFTISTNRDLGEVTAVRILPEDISDNSDVFDKLNIEKISVRKQSTEAVSRQWVVGNVGWIDINYQDNAANSTTFSYRGRSEAEIAKSYQVDYNSYVVNLEVSITTGAYISAKNAGQIDPQLVGQLFGELEYYDGNGQLRKMTFDAVQAMYEYAGKKATYPEKREMAQYLYPEKAQSNPEMMFRANHTDRFILSVDDVSQIVRIIFKARSTVVTTWNIKAVSISLVGSGGRRLINVNDEYEWVGSIQAQPICTHTGTGSIPYTKYLPMNQDNEVAISFTENKIYREQGTDGQLVTLPSRQPQSINDTLNLYVYMSDDSPATSAYTMKATAQYSRIYEGLYQVSRTLTPADDGKKMFYALGLEVSGISTLNSLSLKAELENNVSLVKANYAVVQQVRSGVVIDTYYFNFDNTDASLIGIHAKPEARRDGIGFKQVVTLAFGEGTQETWLIPGEHDAAVALRYTTTNDVNDYGYESAYIFLTDQNYTDLRAGKVVELVFEEPYVKEITGIKLRGSSNLAARVESATVAVYEVNENADSTRYGGWFSFANATPILTREQTMLCTSRTIGQRGTVGQLTLSFTVPTIEENAAAANNAVSAVGMQLSYRDINGVNKQLPMIDNLLDLSETASKTFAPGATVTIRLLIPDVEEIRWLSLHPTDENGREVPLVLGQVSGVLKIGENETTYLRDLRSWNTSDRIALSAIQVTASAVTQSLSTGEETRVTSKNGTASLLVESGQEVTIIPSLQGSTEGYTITAEQRVDEYTKSAAGALEQSGSIARFRVDNESEQNTAYYRITISSDEVPMMKTVIEIAVQPRGKQDKVEQEEGAENIPTETENTPAEQEQEQTPPTPEQPDAPQAQQTADTNEQAA